MSFRWKTILCRPPWIIPCPILGNGRFAVAGTRYISIQLFEIQNWRGILALIQNPWSLRQWYNNKSCPKSSILPPRFFPDFLENCVANLFGARTEIWLYLILETSFE
jgi:hypothetical protein